MSDFSWAPFGPSSDEELPPLPPLPPLDGDEADAPELELPAVEVDYELEALPFEEDDASSLPPPPPPPGAADNPWSSAPPPPVVGDIAPTKKPRGKKRSNKDANQALMWGILGITFCPILIPSIAAIRMGTRARSAGGGISDADSGAARTAVALGWVGVAIWALVILVVIGSA